MRKTRNLTAAAASAVTALMLATACTSEDSASPAPAPREGQESPSGNTSAAADFEILGAANLVSPARWGVTAFGDPEAPVAVLDVPEGFQGHESWVWTDEQGPSEFAQIAFWKPTGVPRDPCRPRPTTTPLGPTVDDLAAALVRQRRTTTTRPVPVSLDGHEGLYVELTTPSSFDYEACGPDGMLIFETDQDPRALAETVIDRYWILDVDGHRVVISALTLPVATSATSALITGVARTVEFVPAP